MTMNEDQVYRIESVLKSTIVKMAHEADINETEESERDYEVLRSAFLSRSSLYSYHYSVAEITQVIPRLSISEANTLIAEMSISNTTNLISKAEKDDLVMFKRIQILDKYVERNEYYRKLTAQPPLKHTKDDFVLVNEVPIHLLSDSDVYDIKKTGELNYIIVKYNDNSEYDYLRYLDKKIDIIVAREAEPFEILYIPNTEEGRQFRSHYNAERKVYMRTYSSQLLTQETQYNEIYEANIIKFNTVTKMEMSRISPQLDKNLFTEEEAIDIWKEYGLAFPRLMPSSYRNVTTFMLNYLVMFKGTNFVMEYISKHIFSGIQLYKYYIRKKLKVGVKFPIAPGTEPWEYYDVEFIMVPYSEYFTDDMYDSSRTSYSYDDVVAMDPKWRNTDELKRAVFSENFSFVESKYLGMNYFVDLSRFSIDFSVMTNIFLKHRSELEKIESYYVSSGKTENFFNMFVYFLHMFGKITAVKNVADPNTIMRFKHDKVYTFNVPNNIDELRAGCITLFHRTDFKDLLDQFPQAINNNDDFFDLVEKLDKQVDLVSRIEDIILVCDTHQQVEYARGLYSLVLLTRTNPVLMRQEQHTVDGFTYIEYMNRYATSLYVLHGDIEVSSTDDRMYMEFDNILNWMLEILNDGIVDGVNDDEGTNSRNLRSLIRRSSGFINGIDRYMMYILTLFKSYSVDFLTEEPEFHLDAKRNYLKLVDQMYFDTDAEMEEKYNSTHIDKVEIEDKTVISSEFRTSCILKLCTEYGDIDIN